MEAIELDLRNRLEQAEEIWLLSSDTKIKKSFSKMRLSEMIDFIEKFVTKNPYARKLSLRHRERFQDMLRQIKAITRINRLMMGEVPTEKFPNPATGFSQTVRSTTSDSTNVEALVTTENAHTGSLPRRSRLWRIAADYYRIRQERGLKPSHAILETLIPRMRRYDRRPEALDLLEAVYESQYVQGPDGVAFSSSLLSVWLHISFELKNAERIAEVLWRMIDSRVEIGADLVLLVRMAAIRGSSKKNVLESERHEVIEENMYLNEKLQSMHWIQRGGRVTAEKPQLMEYESWTERVRREPMVA